MPLTVSFFEILVLLVAVVGMVYLVGRVWSVTNRHHNPHHLETDPQLGRELEEIQARLLDLEERVDSAERLLARQRQERQISEL